MALAEEQIRDRAAEILRDPGYQLSLPKPRAMAELPLGPLALLLKILLWAGLAVLVIMAIVWLARRLSAPPRDVVVSDAAPPAAADIAIESAEALAAAGRWAEAIHALLLETLSALARAARITPSLTSREIVERVRLPREAREALSGLVFAVEVSRFGGAAAREDDYRACLARFHAFLESYRRGA
ncbi:MAG: DUF4129 domain-containing protein [Anaeromyxobacteraceae bacterium]